MAKTDERQICCSFCGKHESKTRLIAGPDVYICGECVEACCDLLKENTANGDLPDHLPTPMEIKAYMDSYIIGQDDAKKTIAIAIRNRVRRKRLPENMRDEVSPKNILSVQNSD